VHNEATVIGRVVGVIKDEKATIVIVEDASNPKYVSRVACRFFDKWQGAASGARHGDVVRVSGCLSSREFKTKWYTDFTAFRLTVLPMGAMTASAVVAPPDIEPMQDTSGDDVPF
jgi:hypothetical protein